MPSLVRKYVLQLTLGTYCEDILLHYSYYLNVFHSFHDYFLCLLGKCALLILTARKLVLPKELFPTELIPV